MSAPIYDLYELGGTSDVPCTCWFGGYSHWYLNWSSRVLTRTQSQIWGRLYLPMLLLRVGMLTLMYMNSLIVQAKPCPSLPTVLKLSMGMRWQCIKKGALRCSLCLSPNVVADSPIYSSQTCHTYCVRSVLWGYQYVLVCSVASEVFVDVILTTYAFGTLGEAFYMWNYYVSLICVVVWLMLFLVLFGLFCWKFLGSTHGPW